MRLFKLLLFFTIGLAICTQHLLAQTIIFSDPGASYNNTDGVTTDTYGPVDVSNCTSIFFSIDYNFSLPFAGFGNMESSDECPFGIPPCQGDPNDPQGGGCNNCWDFFYVQFQLDGSTVQTELVGVPGSINQSGTITYGPICTNGAADAGIIVQTQTWAADESITFENITITCWDATASSLTANPDPACSGVPFTLTAELTDPPAVSSTLWTGPGAISTPGNLVTTVTGAPMGTNTYTFTATDDNACTASSTIDVTVTQGPTMDDPPNITVCSNDPVDVFFTGTGNPQFDWTNSNPAIGLGVSGMGDISFSAATVVAPITGTVTVTPSENGCIGPNQTFSITVNPVPSVNLPNDVTVCGGLPVNVNFTGSFGASFSWTNDNTNIGLGASGNGNINFTSANVSNQELATITVTPMQNGCPGTPVMFLITVNPTPMVDDPPNLSVCAGDPVDLMFSGSGNPQYFWTNSNVSIGLPPSGTGDISFTAANVINTTTANLTVTPSENGCSGPNQNFTITVTPLPSADQPNDISVCGGTPILSVFTGTLGANFTWTNDNTNIGLGAAGNGSLNFTAANVVVQEVANITVTPLFNGCPGEPVMFTITVNPAPTVVNPGNQTVCSGALVDLPFSGTVNPTFSWTNSNIAIGLGNSGNGDINFIAANVAIPLTGNLTVTPSENGCMGSPQNFSITVTPTPTMNPPDSVVLACAGSNIMVPFTGSPGATFNWTNSDTIVGLGTSGSGNINFIAASLPNRDTAIITVTPVIGNCLGAPDTFLIVIDPAPTVMDPPNQTVCSGLPVTVTFSGSNNASFEWVNNNTGIGLDSSGTGNISFTADSVGLGTITVTPVENGCFGASQMFNITVIGSPVVDQPMNLNACAGTPVGVPFMGTPNANFSWTNNNTAIGLSASGTGNISFTAAGVVTPTTATISVTPSLGGCNGTTLDFDITINPLPTISITAVTCASDLLTYEVVLSSSGDVVTATAGVVSGGAGSFTISGIPAGTNVSVFSSITATGCQFSQAVNAPDCSCVPVNTPTMPNNPSICEGDPIPDLTVSTDIGTVVDWYDAPSGGVLLLMGSTSYNPGAGLMPGLYTFYAEARDTATSCISPTRLAVTLTIKALPVVTQPMDQSVCAGSQVLVNFTGTASATMDWTNSDINIGLGASGSGDISFLATNAGGLPLTANLVVTPSLNGCVGAVQNFMITVNPVPTVAAPANQTLCAGAAVMVNFTGTAGATFDWTNANTAIGLGASGMGDISFTAANVGAPTLANLSVTPSLSGCSGSTQNFTITINPVPTVAAPANQSVCAGAAVMVNFVGTNGATFNWTNSNTAIGLGASGAGNISFSAINAGTMPLIANLMVTPTQNGCPGVPQNFTITVNPIPSLTINSTVCSGNLMTYSINATSNANTLTSTLGTVSGNGTNFNITGIPVGMDVTLTVTNTVTGCSQQQMVVAPNCSCPPIMPPNGPNFPVICEGTATPALMVNVGAGLTADWYTTPAGGVPVFVGSTSYTPPGPFTPGTYIFYAESREMNGTCISPTRTPVFLTVNATPTMTQPLNQAVCAGFVISVGFNGTSGAVFNWTNSNASIGLPASGTGNISFTSINPGITPVVATISVTPTLLGCFGQPRTFTITVNPSPVLTDPMDVTTCVGQAVAVNFTVTSSATLNWTNNNPGIGLPGSGMGDISFSSTNAGNAIVTVIPTANGCSGTPQSFNIAVLSNPVMNNPGTLTACANDMVSLPFTGDPGATYTWTNSNPAIGLAASGSGNLNFSAANNAGVQTAQITVTPQVGICTGASEVFSITINPLPTTSIAGLSTICNGDSTSLTAIGATNVSWSSGENTVVINISPTSSTTYTATVTELGCVATASATVTVNQPTSATVNLLTCDTAQVGTVITVIPNAAGCDSTISTVTTLDIPGCTPAPSITDGSVSCFGDSDGVLNLSATGGLAPYDYNWSNGLQTGTGQISSAGSPIQIPNLPAGTYTVTITAANGLTNTISAIVTTPAVLTTQTTAALVFGQYALSCEDATDATINSTVAGGTAQYQYAWSVGGQNSAMLTGVGAGTYSLTVTDANLCTAVSSVTIQDPPPLSFDISLASVECGEDAATALITPSNGVNPFTVTVDGIPAPGGLMPSIVNGNHLVEISDANGCMADTMVTVVLPVAPSISLPAEATVALGQTLILEAQTNLTTWQSLVWTPLPDTSCANCLIQEWIPDISRVYEVAITDTFGCTAIASVRVTVNKLIDIYIPNVFTPNLDGNNDFWILNAGPSVVALNALQIFDRWGSMVYFWDSPVPVNEWPGWDGVSRGDMVNPGVFVYYLEVRLANGEVVVKKGDLTVLR